MSQEPTFEQSVLQGQLIMGKQVMEMYFELVQDNSMKSVTQAVNITGEDFILKLERK